jgi:hypothetical protein
MGRKGAGEGKMKAVPPGRHGIGVCTSFSVEACRGPDHVLASAWETRTAEFAEFCRSPGRHSWRPLKG